MKNVTLLLMILFLIEGCGSNNNTFIYGGLLRIQIMHGAWQIILSQLDFERSYSSPWLFTLYFSFLLNIEKQTGPDMDEEESQKETPLEDIDVENPTKPSKNDAYNI